MSNVRTKEAGLKICRALLACVCCLGAVSQAKPRRAARPPYAVGGRLSEPRLFAEGIISTRDDEFGGTFTADGKTCFFSRSVPRSYLYTILVSHFRGGRWTTPEVAPFAGRYRDFDPVLSPDGNKIYFASDRPVGDGPKADYDIWVVERKGGGWGEPRNLGPPVNTEYNEHFASATSDGTIYFSSDRPGAMGGEGDSDIYRARLAGGKYSEAEHLGEAVNSNSFELDCIIAPDESFLLVGAAGRREGLGNYDIYVSRREGGVWTPYRNLGPKVNSLARDYSPRLSPDGKYLFFTSERDFATPSLVGRLTYPELVRNLHGTLNGSGNIYQIELSAIGLAP